MLPRAASRALRLRAGPAPFPRASPIAFAPSSASQWTRNYAKNHRPNNQHSRSGPVRPDTQPEFDRASRPDRNRTPQSTGGAQKSREHYNKKQEEFEGPQSPEANTKASTEPAGGKPLPDLRQGIPSTFAEEFLKEQSKAEGKAEDKAHHPINITEDPDKEPDSTHSGGKEGGAGELPKSAYETSVDRRRARVANWSYIAVLLFGTVGAVYLGRNWETDEEEKQHADIPSGWSLKLMYERAKARISGQMGYYTEPVFPKLLPDMDPVPPYTLVISLEDMLVHSEWTRETGWRLAKRPGVDYFLRYLSQYYELVIFTSQRSQDADPIIRKLDPFRVVMWPLFREASRYEKGEYIKASSSY